MRINSLRTYLHMNLFYKGNTWALLCVQDCSQKCPKALQQGKGCSQPLPQPQGLHSSPTWGPWVQELGGQSQRIAGDSDLHPLHPVCSPSGTPSRNRLLGRDKRKVSGPETTWPPTIYHGENYFVVTLSVRNEFPIIIAFSVNPSGSNNDFQFIQKGCYFPWQKNYDLKISDVFLITLVTVMICLEETPIFLSTAFDTTTISHKQWKKDIS